MKRITRILGVFLCLVVAISGNAFAADNVIDTSTASEGYFTVCYDETANVKMKVGVSYEGKTEYFDYSPETESTYALNKGDGEYTITLYRNVRGTSYAKVTSTRASVELDNGLAPYLTSTTEITFEEGDEVSNIAAQLCDGVEEDSDKVVAIHNYIAENFEYDHSFAKAVKAGKIKNYTPDTAEILATQKGVCYDFSALFAAMCRSQGIACAVSKGYINEGYHAWNMVWIDGEWIAVDLTASISQHHAWAEELSDCTVSLSNYRDYTY